MPTPNRHPQRGNVLVLTMFALIPLLGFLGLAVDLGYMFNYKLRAQIAVDAAALAAALEPYTAGDLSKNTTAALDIADRNGFGDYDPTDPANGCDAPDSKQICIVVRTPPLEGAFVGSAAGEAYEVDLRQNLPTYFMSAVGVTSFPIHVRAVAKSSGTQGPCLTVGDAVILNNIKLTGTDCDLYFSGSFTSGGGGSIQASATNVDTSIYTIFGDTPYEKDMPLPQPPASTFPSFLVGTRVACPKTESDHIKVASMTPGTYDSIIINGSCVFGKGQYQINGKIRFDNNAKASGDKLILLTKGGVMTDFGGSVRLTNNAPGYEKFIIWAQSGIAQAGFTSGEGILEKSKKTLTFKHDPGSGANRLLLVSVVTGATSNTATDARKIIAVTFAGLGMNVVAKSELPSAEVNTYLYQLVDPPTGEADVVVTASDITDSTKAPVYAAATSFNNVDKNAPLGSPRVSETTGTSVGVTAISSAEHELVFAVVGIDADGSAFTISHENNTDGQYAVSTYTTNARIAVAISTKPGATNVDMDWSLSQSQNATVIAVPIKLMEGGYIKFDSNAKPEIFGHLYAPNVPFQLGGTHNLSPDSSLVKKPGLAE